MNDLPEWMQWVEACTRALLPVIALLAAFVAYKSYRQRRVADNRSEWWRRVSDAIELCTTSEEQVGRNTGMALMTHLLKDTTATQVDAKMLGDVVDSLIDEIVDQP